MPGDAVGYQRGGLYSYDWLDRLFGILDRSSGLYPLAASRTRLVSRGAERIANTFGAWVFMRVMEPAAFIMTRRMLLAEAARRGAPGCSRSR